MRLITTIFIAQLLSTLVFAQKSFQVKVSLPGITTPQKAFLYYRNAEGNQRDSTFLKNGKFSFKGKIEKPFLATLIVQEVNFTGPYPMRESINFYVAPGLITINGFSSIKTAIVKGGEIQKDYQDLQDSLKSNSLLLENIYALIRSRDVDDSTKARLRNLSRKLYDKSVAIENNYIKSHTSSIVSWDIVSDRGIIIDPDKLEPVFNSLAEELKQQPAAIELKERIETAKLLKIGNPAIEFVSNNADGVPVSLSSFRGKYVLIDFWASWCGPCRAENPNMVKAYNNLKDKNFEIFGVSLDDDRDKWLKAVKEDKLPWIQVSDLKGFNTVAKTYGIRAIPQNLLLNPEGKIIAHNLRGETLTEEVKKRMGL